MASARPPRNGPTWRHCMPLNNFSSIAPAGIGAGVGLTAKEIEQTRTNTGKISLAKEREVSVIIRLKCEACRVIQLECREADSSSGDHRLPACNRRQLADEQCLFGRLPKRTGKLPVLPRAYICARAARS